MKISNILGMGIIAASLVSCGSDYFDTEYTAYLDSEAAGEAAGHNPDVFLNGMWSYMADYTDNHDTFNYMAVLLATNMMGEDIAAGGNHWFIYDYELDNRAYNYRRTSATWLVFYTLVAKANEVISLYPNVANLTAGQKSLLGQALAVRGMSYYYLIQLFRNPTNAQGEINYDGKGIPLKYVTADGKTTEEIDAASGANTVKAVFDQIELDLTSAVKYLTDSEYSRPNKNYIDASVANGLLARYYLLAHKWQQAADAAALASAGYSIMDNTGLHDGFMDITNEEWMWGFDESTETTTVYASFFSHISNLTPGYAGLGYMPKLIDARLYSNIPDDDKRKTLFNGPDGDSTQPTAGARKPYANLKFGDDGNWTMDYVYMRAAEMVLIEAEAYAHLEQGEKAAQTLKRLMVNRQPSWNKTTVTVEDVYFQRRIELWGEGFLYFDLKRLNKGIDRSYEGTNHLAGYQKVVPAQDVRWTYQIPRAEMQENKKLTEDDQNP